MVWCGVVWCGVMIEEQEMVRGERKEMQAGGREGGEIIQHVLHLVCMFGVLRDCVPASLRHARLRPCVSVPAQWLMERGG